MHIRRIDPDEWAVLREMRLASLLDAPEAFGQRYETAASEPEAEWRSAARASSSGERRAWFIARGGVGAGARRSGAGRHLVDAVAAWAAGWGGKRVVIWVFGANEGALRFYERLGFRVVADGADAESGRAFGALAMELSI